METKKINSTSSQISLEGLTREIICDLLEIYNKNKVPESHSKCYAGSGIRVDASSLKKIVASFGVYFTNEEVMRAIISFSRGDALTFSDFINFYLWYIPVYQKILNKTTSALDSFVTDSLKDDILKLIKETKLLDQDIAGFLTYDFNKFAEINEKVLSASNMPRLMMSQLNQLPRTMNFSRKDNITPYLTFDITLMNIFGLIPYEYTGIESDLPSLDVFVQLELCNQTFKSAVFPARFSPSISQTFSFEFHSPSEMSFLDASWWIQNAKLKISVYAVHYLDNFVAFHLLGTAHQPLIPLLIDQHGRTTCTINLQSLAPSSPIPILISITNKCNEIDKNDNKKEKMIEKNQEDVIKTINPLIYHSAPIEQLIFERFIRQIRHNLLVSNKISPQSFVSYCNFFKEISVRFPAREYQILGFDEMNIAHFINTFLYPKKLQFKELNEIEAKKLIYIISLKGYTVFDRPEPEVMQIRNLITTKTCKLDPNIMERALLLCNLLNSKGIEAYVCIGDHQFQRYVWVMTRSCKQLRYESLPDFMMFDCGNKAYTISSFINHRFEFPTPTAIDRIDGQQQIIFSHGINPLLLGINSISSRQEEDQYFTNKKDITRNPKSGVCHWSVTGIWPDRVPCGLKVATVFNSEQIYCNIQKIDDVEVVEWDLNNTSNWAPLYRKNPSTEFNPVYPERLLYRVIKEPKFIFTDEEKMKISRLLFIKKFNMIKNIFQKDFFDKFTKDSFQFYLAFEETFALEKVYRNQNFLENNYKAHLSHLLETQLLLNLTPIQRQILNAYLICLGKLQEGQEIDLKQERFSILLKSQTDFEREKINKLIQKINFSILKLNSNGHCKFIEYESVMRFFYTFDTIKEEILNIPKKVFDVKLYQKFLEKNLLTENDIDACNHYILNFQLDYLHLLNYYDDYININFKPIRDEFVNESNKILENMGSLSLNLVYGLKEDEFNIVSKKMRKIDPEFDECFNENAKKDAIKNYVKSKITKSQFFMLEIFLQHCESLTPLIQDFTENESSSNNENEEELLTTNKPREINQGNKKDDKANEKILSDILKKCDVIRAYMKCQRDFIIKDNLGIDPKTVKLLSADKIITDIIIKDIVIKDIKNTDKMNADKMNAEKMNADKMNADQIIEDQIIEDQIIGDQIIEDQIIKEKLNNDLSYHNFPLYIPESFVKRELLSIIREETDSIYQYYSVEKFFDSKFLAWNSDNDGYMQDEVEEKNTKQKVMKEKLEILALIEMVLEILYKSINDKQFQSQVFNKPNRIELYDKNFKYEEYLEVLFNRILLNFKKIPMNNRNIQKIINDYQILFYHENKDMEIMNGNNTYNTSGKELLEYLNDKYMRIMEEYKKIVEESLIQFLKGKQKIKNNLTNYIKFKVCLYIKKALVTIRKTPKYSLPYPNDWFVRCNLNILFKMTKNFIIETSKNNCQNFDSIQFVENEFYYLNRTINPDDQNSSDEYQKKCLNERKILNDLQLYGQISFCDKLIENINVIDKSLKGFNPPQQGRSFPIIIDDLFNSIISRNETIEFEIFKNNVFTFKAIQKVLHNNMKIDNEMNLADFYEKIGQSIPDIDSTIEEFNSDLLDVFRFDAHLNLIEEDELNRSEELIKKRIESFRLTQDLIDKCTVRHQSSSYLIPKKIIVKPPNLIDFYPNSMSNLFMSARLIINHIRSKPFFFLFYTNTDGISKKKQQIQIQNQNQHQQHQNQQQQSLYQQKQEEQKQKNQTMDSMLNLKNQLLIQKENRIKRFDQLQSITQDIQQFNQTLENKIADYNNKIEEIKSKIGDPMARQSLEERTQDLDKTIKDDKDFNRLRQYIASKEVSISDKNKFKETSEKIEQLIQSINNLAITQSHHKMNKKWETSGSIKPILSIQIPTPTSPHPTPPTPTPNNNNDNKDVTFGHPSVLGPPLKRVKPRKSTLCESIQSSVQIDVKNYSRGAMNNNVKHKRKSYAGYSQDLIPEIHRKVNTPNDINLSHFRFSLMDKKKKNIMKSRWEFRQKVKELIKSIHLSNESVVPFIPFDSEQENLIQYIEYTKTEPNVQFNENQKKELNNLLNLDVAMSTSSSLLIFHKKWSEERLIKKIQKTLVEFEDEIIENGRYDINKLHKIVTKSIRSHRYMLRVSKHKIDDPLYLTDQLSLSGALTSSCGAEKCIIVAQPFRYILDAKSTWIVLLFIYKVPDNLSFSKKENVK